jgi:hypothetical protein
MTWIGGTVEKEATFRDTGGDLANPLSVTGIARKPTGATTAATVNNTATGKYDVLFPDVDVVGMWYYRIVGAGNDVDAVVEGSFRVRRSSI